MQIAVLGTGMVGEAIATKLVQLGHEVKMGSRTRGNAKASAWAEKAGERASEGTFEDAAEFGEVIFLCTQGAAVMDVLHAAGQDNLKDKVLIDVTNPLDFSKGMPPTLFVSNDDSLGERVQRTFPEAKVVKTLNIVNSSVMVDPARVTGEQTMFVCGNDPGARRETRELLESFGWRDIIEFEDISAARATESLLPIWLRLWSRLKTADFGIRVVR